MKPIKFEECKEKIQKGLDEHLKGVAFPGETKGFTVVDGFFNVPIQSELSGSFVIGGPAIPMVAIVGNKTGRIYYFALKVIAPDIEGL